MEHKLIVSENDRVWGGEDNETVCLWNLEFVNLHFTRTSLELNFMISSCFAN